MHHKPYDPATHNEPGLKAKSCEVRRRGQGARNECVKKQR